MPESASLREAIYTSLKSLGRSAGVSIHRWPAPHTLEHHLQYMLRRLAIDCVIDVGANRGHYVRLIRQIGYAGDVRSFEPLDEHIQAMSSEFAQDRLWKAFGYGLGSTRRSATIHVHALDELSSTLPLTEEAVRRIGSMALAQPDRTIQIEALRDVLPTILPDFERRNIFLKVDTQGTDLDVLRGAGDLIRHVAGVQIEVSLVPNYSGQPTMCEALSELARMGFHPTGFFPVPGNVTPSGALVEMDCVARRED